MKISQNIATVAPVRTQSGAASAARSSAPVSESSRPVPQPPRPVETRSRVDDPLKSERVTATAAQAVREQHIQPTPTVPPPPVTKRPDPNIGSHNANPGSQAYAAMAASGNARKGGRVDTSA